MTTPKKTVNYSRNFSSPHIYKRDPHALTYDELKRARQSLQQEREALQAARESLASERLQFNANRRHAENYGAANFASSSQLQGPRSFISGSEAPYQTNPGSRLCDMGLNEHWSSSHSRYDELIAEDSPSMPSYSSNMLQNQKFDEARQMLDQYNRAWELLDKRDANVPYPTVFGTIEELADPSHIYSPHTSAPSTWALDKIMQVNAEAFFQRGMGIRPLYAETRGILRTLDGLPTATDRQLHDLAEYLKKERNRWHPDKLLLRGGGQGGSSSSSLSSTSLATSNVLITNPASRAVLQAVHDMLDACRAEIARRVRIYESM